MGVYALFTVFAFGISVRAQTPEQDPAPQTQNGKEAPLPPVESRDQQVREYDPLDQSGQDSKENKDRDKTARDAEQRREQEQTPTPGSIAANDREKSSQRSGPQVVDGDSAEEPVQEYSGPAVLSRSYSVNRPLIPQQLKWRESVGVSSIYDTGINRQVNPDGSPGAASTLAGAQVTWSLIGRHYFRHDEVGVSYTGNMSQFSGAGGYNGTNQSITVDYSHRLSHHLSVNLSGTGSIFSQNYALENASAGSDTIANINLGSSPNIQIFDLGTKQFSSQADLTWQKTSRLSFNLGTSYFGIDRDSPALLGVTGQQARGDVNYRLTRKITIGTYYSFSHYLYPHGFGNSDTNTAGLIYSYAFSRTMQIRLRGGLSRVESLGLQSVEINPVIAALLGQSSGIVDSWQTLRTSDISAQLIKDFRAGTTLSFAYARGVSPGNGVFQTSQQESISGTMTAKIMRSYLLSADVGRDTLTSVAQALGKYQSEFGRVSLSRPYRRGLSLNFGVEYRYFDVSNFGSVRNQLRITSGVTWQPGAGRLWPFQALER
jgi:hypothetical protein